VINFVYITDVTQKGSLTKTNWLVGLELEVQVFSVVVSTASPAKVFALAKTFAGEW